MKMWKDNNHKFQTFINNEYWINNYIKTRDDFLQNRIYVYTEAAKILAYIVVNNSSEILDIQVSPEIQREGIGKLLLEKLKREKYDRSKIFFLTGGEHPNKYKAKNKINVKTNYDEFEKLFERIKERIGQI